MCRPDTTGPASISLKLKAPPCHEAVGENTIPCRPEFDIKSITIYTPLDERRVSIKGYQAKDHRIKVCEYDPCLRQIKPKETPSSLQFLFQLCKFVSQSKQILAEFCLFEEHAVIIFRCWCTPTSVQNMASSWAHMRAICPLTKNLTSASTKDM